MNQTELNIGSEFSRTPGARYITDGKFSGEEFYETLLKPKFLQSIEDQKDLLIILDGTHGYATSFLDEAFGRLSKDFTSDLVKQKIHFVSNEEPSLINEIWEYVKDAETSR